MGVNSAENRTQEPVGQLRPPSAEPLESDTTCTSLLLRVPLPLRLGDRVAGERPDGE